MTHDDLVVFVPLFGIVLGAIAVLGWIFTSWLKMHKGYPLQSDNGQTLYPAATTETVERVKLLTSENAQLRAEVGAMKDRLATVERIVTDRSFSLGHEIEQLRSSAN